MPVIPLTVSITTGTSTDSREPATIHIRIEDEASGEVLAAIAIPEAEWWRLATGSVQRRTGFVSPHLDRVGSHMETEIWQVPRDVAFAQRSEEGAVLDWARDQPWFSRWTDHRPRLTNHGWEIVTHRWITVSEA